MDAEQLPFLPFIDILDNIKKKILEALEHAHGIVSMACKNADVPRSTFYHWLKEDVEFKQAVDEIQDVSIDYVESKLFDRIKNDDTTATIFYLKTKGKKRGYVERQEIAAHIDTDKKPSWFDETT